MKPPKPINRISRHQSKRLAEYARVKCQWWRDLCATARECSIFDTPGCEWPECKFEAEPTPHHKHGRTGSLLCERRLFVALCGTHHTLIHTDADTMREARKLGLLANKGWWGRNPFEE